MAQYSKKVMEHFKNPKNVGILDNASGIGKANSDKCDDVVKIYLKIKGDIIEDVKFETYGCVGAIASSSAATELIKGKSICNALLITKDDIIEALDGLPEEKIHGSILAEEAIKNALDDYYSKEPEKYIDENVNCHCRHQCGCNCKGCKKC